MPDYAELAAPTRGASPEVRPPGPIGRLKNITDQFDDATGLLSQRLAPVLVGEMSNPVGPEDEARNPNQSELDALLDALHQRVVRIRSITERVDL